MDTLELKPQVSTPADAAYVRPRQSSEVSPSLYALLAWLLIAATSWYLLKELGPLLRPLVLAVFLAYIVLPIHLRLRRRISSTTSAGVIIGGTLALFWGLAMMTYGSLVELNADMPRLIERAKQIVDSARAYGRDHLPRGLVNPVPGEAEVQGWNSARASIRILVSNGAGLLAEALVVGVYLVFMLLEVRRFPDRIKAGFGPEQAESILGVVARINAATTRYLRAKTMVSLATAIPTALVLWAFGVRYPLLWGVLTFFGNFIPYVGSLVALAFPILLAFLDLQTAWHTWTVVLLLGLIQVMTNNVLEPTFTGNAVDLSPLVAVVALAFWSLCWGVTGMLLAIPLTAILKIVGENMAYTRPLAALMANGDG